MAQSKPIGRNTKGSPYKTKVPCTPSTLSVDVIDRKKIKYKRPRGALVVPKTPQIPSESTAILPLPKTFAKIKTADIPKKQHIPIVVNNWVFDMPNMQLDCVQPKPAKNGHDPTAGKQQFAKDIYENTTVRSIEDSKYCNTPNRQQTKASFPKKICKVTSLNERKDQFVGICPEKPTIEEIAKMSTAKQKFFLTQDPRKKHCLKNPNVEKHKRKTDAENFKEITKMVKIADNVQVDAEQQSNDSYRCEVIDLENPFNLDFQGIDYKETYEADEQEVQNQRMYRRISRYIDRKNVRRDIIEMLKNEQINERTNVPDCFSVSTRILDEPQPHEKIPVSHGKLFRTDDKPHNKIRIQQEHQNRRMRYKDKYEYQKQQLEQKEEQRKKDEAKNVLLNSLVKTDNCFKDTLHDVNDVFMRTYEQVPLPEQIVIERREFPKTLRETLAFKQNLKAQNRIARAEAIVKNEFCLQRLGKEKPYPELELDTSSVKGGLSVKSGDDQFEGRSTDDEDGMEVGKQNSKFYLRGFHFRLGNTIRGKFNKYEKTKGFRNEQGCMTREEWVNKLAPKRERVKLDFEKGLLGIKNSHSSDLVLFYPEARKALSTKTSAVHKYIQSRLGLHYKRELKHKPFKIVKPRLPYLVKKFNMVSYLYGDELNEEDLKLLGSSINLTDSTEVDQRSAKEYIRRKKRIYRYQHQIAKEKRMRFLGIPIEPPAKHAVNLCDDSNIASNRDWVPEPEPDYDDSPEAVQERIAKANAARLPLTLRGNMPAPEYREPTLRCHPENPRDYTGLRVNSAVFDQTVTDTGFPHLIKLPDDKINFANVREPKRPYTAMFDGRHHHDHWNPTQRNAVKVHYQPKIAKPETAQIPELEVEHKIKSEVEHFKEANPPCNAFVSMDLSVAWQTASELIAAQRAKPKKVGSDDIIADVKGADKCQQYDVVFHSRHPEEFPDLDYPGHAEYLKLIQDLREAIEEHRTIIDPNINGELIDREVLLKELEEDLVSIESCLSSISSSICTNLTNDSGSFLLLEGKTKVPLDYVRRGIVPFEEYQRSRFQAIPIDFTKEEQNPYQVMPFSGQLKAQNMLVAPKDSFFTFTSRLRNGLRLRLEVPVEGIAERLLGCTKNKYSSRVTTDIDNNYITTLNDYPPIGLCKLKSRKTILKDAIRLKFESLLIQGQIVRNKIYNRLNEDHWQTMQKTKLLFEDLFDKWRKQEYEAAMSVVYEVKQYYDITDALKKKLRELERVSMIINLDIIFIESKWIERLMYQNFHYLLGDDNWRYENDWMHRLDGDQDELENYALSIMKRSTVNIRPRAKDNAWAIKQYYEDVYLPNQHPLLIVFPDVKSFLQGVHNLKVKTFLLLLELHFTLTLHIELETHLESFQEWCWDELSGKQKYVERKCEKKYFMEERADLMKSNALTYLDTPFENSFDDSSFNRSRAVIAEVWRQVVPPQRRGASEQDQLPIHMVAMISQEVTDLIRKFETIPPERRSVEVIVRKHVEYQSRQSRKAFLVEKRIEKEMQKVVKNLEPPYQKPPRVGKLPRSYLKTKKKKVKLLEYRVSDHSKSFFRAFSDAEGDHVAPDYIPESLHKVQTAIVPFYFDHFLKLNGYIPNYNFRTTVELRDGPEEDRIHVHELLPILKDKMAWWAQERKRVMLDNINKNPRMYENVQY